MTTQKKFLRGYIVKNYLVGEINLWWAKVYWGEILPLGRGGGEEGGREEGGEGEQILDGRGDSPLSLQ